MFNSFVRSLTRALRTLLEVTSLNMLLRHDARRGRDDLLDINLSLPFQSEVNTGFGVLAKVYLDALTHINGRQRVRDPNAEGVREAKQMALDICEETFQGVKYPKAEVERGFRFWDVVSPLVLLAVRQNRSLTTHHLCFFFSFSKISPVCFRTRTLAGTPQPRPPSWLASGCITLARIWLHSGPPCDARPNFMRGRRVVGTNVDAGCGMRQCGQTLTAMRQLHSEGAVLRELIDQFEAAEAWLAPMRP